MRDRVKRLRKRKGRQTGEAGQSTVEFALTMMLFMAFAFFFIKLAMFMAYGNYVHYATFMAARAYLSAGPDKQDQVDRAKAVIVKMLKKSEGEAGTERFQGIAIPATGGDLAGAQIGEGSNFNKYDFGYSWMEGVRYSFRGKLFLIPFGRRASSDRSWVNLTSESWLGREPDDDECQKEMEKLGIYDNGC